MNETLNHDPPLYVDLDGTLIATDTLIVSLQTIARHRPLWLLVLPFFVLRGRAFFKQKVAALVTVDAERLPYRSDVVTFLQAEKARGRRLILATAAHRQIADAVAQHLGIFDDVIATDGADNLKGAAKLSAIRAKVGDGAFDYAGDSTADLPIFLASRRAILVNPRARLLRIVQASCDVDRVFP